MTGDSKELLEEEICPLVEQLLKDWQCASPTPAPLRNTRQKIAHPLENTLW